MENKEKIRIGIIGAGQISRVGHGPGIREDGRGIIAAISDPDDENRLKFQKHFRVASAYKDHREMLEKEKLDGVIIASPPWVHAVHVEDAAEVCKHILCEKPMATTKEDCMRIIAAEKKHGTIIQMAHSKRFEPGWIKLKQALKNNLIGRVFMMTVYWHYYYPDFDSGLIRKAMDFLKKYGYDIEKKYGVWRLKDKRTGGGDFFDHAPHYIDIMRFLMGDIESIFCETLHCYPTRAYEDVAMATFTLSNKAIGTLEKSTIAVGRPMGSEWGFIFGEKGKIRFRSKHSYKQKPMRIGMYKWYNIPFNLYTPFMLPYGKKQTMFYKQIQYFMDQIKGENTLLNPFNDSWAATTKDAYLSILWTLAGYRSAAEGIKITKQELLHNDPIFQFDVQNEILDEL